MLILDSRVYMCGARSFVLGGQLGGRQKGTGQKRPEPVQVWVKLTLPNTPVRSTQNIRFNEHLPHFLFPPLSTIKLLTGHRGVPVHSFNISGNISELRVGISSRTERAKIFWPHSADCGQWGQWVLSRQSKNRASADTRLGIGNRRMNSVNGGHSVQ